MTIKQYHPVSKSCSPRRMLIGICLSTIIGYGIAQADETTAPSLIKRSYENSRNVILKGLEFVGIKYKRGGNTIDGMDCSRFVQVVFKDAAGVDLPRRAADMSRVGDRIESKRQLKPADLVFFNTLSRSFSHVGIYVGDDLFLHSPSSGGFIRIDDMREPYWAKRYNGARRIID